MSELQRMRAKQSMNCPCAVTQLCDKVKVSKKILKANTHAPNKPAAVVAAAAATLMMLVGMAAKLV